MNKITHPGVPKRLYFHHIPKTGGTTLKIILGELGSGSPPGMAPNGWWKESVETIGQYRFYSAHHLYRHYRKLPKENSFRVTILRNPVDRLDSQFRHFLNPNYIRRRQASGTSQSPFLLDPVTQKQVQVGDSGEFAEKLKAEGIRVLVQDERFHNLVMNYQIKVLAADQLYWTGGGSLVGKSDEEMLEMAVACLNEMALVGTTERYQQFLDLLCSELKIAPLEALTPLNRGKQSTGRREESASAADSIASLIQSGNQLDAELHRQAGELLVKRHKSLVDAGLA